MEKTKVQKRQILIETDGVNIEIKKIEVTSLLEFKAIVDQLQTFVAQQSQLFREQAQKVEEKEPKVEEKVEKNKKIEEKK